MLTGDWWQRAACRGMDPEIFYRGDTYSGRARLVCNGCPVRMECLQDTLAWEPVDFRYGIFGGLTAKERRSLARKIKNAKQKTRAEAAFR